MGVTDTVHGDGGGGGDSWQLVAVGDDWRLAVDSGRRLAVGGWRSLGAVLNKNKSGFLRTALA